MDLATYLAALNQRIPLSKAASWDKVGLQVGDRATTCDKVGVCHEVTAAVVTAATEANVDLLVAYHPLLFDPVTAFVAGASPSGRAYSLTRAGIALHVVHTAWDVAPGGSADALAAVLGLDNPTPFGPEWGSDTVKIVTFVPTENVDAVADALAGAGAGSVGHYTGANFRVEGEGRFTPGPHADPAIGVPGVPESVVETRLEMIAAKRNLAGIVAALVEAHPYEEPAYDIVAVSANAGFIGRRGRRAAPQPLDEFVAHVDEILGTRSRVAGESTKEVGSVAVVPGSGGSFVGAIAGAVDVLVTGDISHHTAQEALSRGTAIVDCGHAPSERPGMRSLLRAVEELGCDTIDLTTINTNPWRE
ncbi:MAG: Nif3-like dinuclear metal center hexameric protein [Actinobacteria bacterium]|nr:Nif3-like dinuclear metal center hexameric protein [Actinomycetota bacterium]